MAVKRLLGETSKGQVVYAYPYLPGTETEWAGWNYAGGGRWTCPFIETLEADGLTGTWGLTIAVEAKAKHAALRGAVISWTMTNERAEPCSGD